MLWNKQIDKRKRKNYLNSNGLDLKTYTYYSILNALLIICPEIKPISNGEFKSYENSAH